MADEERLPLHEWWARQHARQRVLLERAQDPAATFTREEFDELFLAHLLRRIEYLEQDLANVRRRLR